MFDSGLPRGQSDCTLDVRGRRLVARLPSGDALEIDLDRMEHQPSGADGHSFTSTATNGITITTRDPGVLAAVLQARQSGPARRGLTLPQKLVIIGAAAALTVGSVAVLLVGPMARVVVSAIPLSADRDLGRQGLPGALLPLHLGDRQADPAVNAVLSTVLERLQPALGRPELSFEITVVDSKVANAFALPDGHILVTTALLALLESSDELAGVLAHELEHVACRHVVELLVRQTGLKVLVMGLRGESIGHALLARSASIAALGFNRRMESEADERGLDLLSRALVDPQAAVRVMERMAALETLRDDGPPEYLRTHPITRKRIEAMNGWLGKHPPQGAFAVEGDWAVVKRWLSRGR